MLSIVVWNPSDISDLLFLSLIDLSNWMTYHPTTWMVRQHFNIPSSVHFFFGLVIFVCRFWVIRPFYGSVIPSTLWTCKIVPHFGWSVHFVAAIPSTLWTYKIIPCFGWSVHFVAATPSSVWTYKFIPCFGWSVHFVAATPSTLWTCKIIPRFGWSVRFEATIPSILWTCKIIHR